MQPKDKMITKIHFTFCSDENKYEKHGKNLMTKFSEKKFKINEQQWNSMFASHDNLPISVKNKRKREKNVKIEKHSTGGKSAAQKETHTPTHIQRNHNSIESTKKKYEVNESKIQKDEKFTRKMFLVIFRLCHFFHHSREQSFAHFFSSFFLTKFFTKVKFFPPFNFVDISVFSACRFK